VEAVLRFKEAGDILGLKVLEHIIAGEGESLSFVESGGCRLFKLVKYLTSFMNIFGEEVFWYMFWTMSLGNHEPCTLGITAITIFFFYVPQYDWTFFLQNIAIGTG
jgi:hypothetical protein